MIDFRPFRNTDPPHLAEIWRSQPPQRGLVQPMSASLFESLVVARPFFEREGLIVAAQDGKPLGFAHAGFGPGSEGKGMSTEVGAVALVMVHMPEQDRSIARELLARGEEYLRRRGARTIQGGASRPLAPFYWGLVGGSDQSGVLASDRWTNELLAAQGYRAVGVSAVLQRRLASFRPPIDRRLLAHRRTVRVTSLSDPPAPSWWAACSEGPFDRVRYELVPQKPGPTVAALTLWNMEGFSSNWGVRTMGLVDLELMRGERRQGLATLLVAEALRQVHDQGVALVEAQVTRENTICRALFDKLGFEEVDQATVYRKE